MIPLAQLLLVAAMPLRFAWPEHAEALVEVTDERAIGEIRRTVVLTFRLHVDAIPPDNRLIVRVSDPQVRSIDGTTPGETDPAHELLAVGRVMKAVTPAIVVSGGGEFLGLVDGDRLTANVLAAAGFPGSPPNTRPFTNLLRRVAEDDWSTWVGSWLGAVPSDEGPRIRLSASAVLESDDEVRAYTRGLLIDLAREAKELGDDPEASTRFLEKATYGPVTVTSSVELDRRTMQPFSAELIRTFYAFKGKHRVDGRERRAHRFTWLTSPP